MKRKNRYYLVIFLLSFAIVTIIGLFILHFFGAKGDIGPVSWKELFQSDIIALLFLSAIGAVFITFTIGDGNF